MSTTFGSWLKEKRETTGLSQSEVARRAGISRATMSLYEQDTIGQPRLKQLDKISDVLGVGRDETRSILANRKIKFDTNLKDADTFEIMTGVNIVINHNKAKLSVKQSSEMVRMIQLMLSGMKKEKAAK